MQLRDAVGASQQSKMNMTARTTPFRVSTGTKDEPFAHPKCYARCLQNCSRKISGEHYFTHALLRKIGSDPRGIYLRGAPWQPAGTWIPPHALTAAVLCDRHNSQLSPLDDFASSLDDELVRIHKAAEADHVVSTVVRFHGPNLERWLMKSLCGFVAARPSVFGPHEGVQPSQRNGFVTSLAKASLSRRLVSIFHPKPASRGRLIQTASHSLASTLVASFRASCWTCGSCDLRSSRSPGRGPSEELSMRQAFAALGASAFALALPPGASTSIGPERAVLRPVSRLTSARVRPNQANAADR